MSKKSIIFLTGVCICILGVSVPAMAETTSRRANIKSSGNLDFDNGTVYFTSSDLTYLADEIDNLEDTYKQTSVDALNEVGTFFLSDGTIVNDREQNEVDTDEKKSALSFGNILEGIKKSQSIDSLLQTQVTDKDGNLLFYETEGAQANKDIYSLTTTDTGFPAFYQPANANNLSAGTAAWVDGTLIKGNGSDNAAYYTQGFIDGQQNIYDNLQVEYTFHKHEGSPGSVANGCYFYPIYHQHDTSSPCYVPAQWSSNYQHMGADPVNPGNEVYRCRSCGTYMYARTGTNPAAHKCRDAYYNCGKTPGGTIDSYTLGCNKTEETVESVTIKYYDD